MNKMKKRIISFSLLLLMVLGITSCKGKQEEKQYLKKVDNIIQAIDELPDVVTLDDDIKVREISYSYAVSYTHLLVKEEVFILAVLARLGLYVEKIQPKINSLLVKVKIQNFYMRIVLL